MPNDRSWIEDARQTRMSRDAKVLHRPQIVHNLAQRIEQTFAKGHKRGLMVKGPQGIGKSYSLVNLARYLLASGKYMVIIIPDCSKWENSHDFLGVVLRSVGVDPLTLDLDCETREIALARLIHNIDLRLKEKGMRWVFVFDRVNKIFDRPECTATQDVTMLPFPFSMIYRVLKPGCIISIISEPMNDQMLCTESHPDFFSKNMNTQFNSIEMR